MKTYQKKLVGFLLIIILLTTSCTAKPITSNQSTPTVNPVLRTEVSTPSPTLSPTESPTLPPLTSTSTLTSTPTITLPPTETPFPQLIVDDKNIPMVLVPAGPFTMGVKDRAKIEQPPHTVYLDNYYIDQFEVTFEWFAQFLNEKGNQFEGLANWIEANDPDLRVHLKNDTWVVDEGNEKFPMNEMTWYGARAFCEWRGGRLPTEAEWEKAARGTDERPYPWGDGIDCSLANYASCVHASVPVDSYPEGKSPYGAYNLAGNMMEWVNDTYAPDYYANSPAENPTGPETGSFRIIRGGSWINNVGQLRTTHRYPKLPVLTFTSVGFRCVREVSP